MLKISEKTEKNAKKVDLFSYKLNESNIYLKTFFLYN